METPSCSLISFAEFNYGALKNKVRVQYAFIHQLWPHEEKNSVNFFLFQCQTVREVFARQLMQISGLSGDKAAAILELYSTPQR